MKLFNFLFYGLIGSLLLFGVVMEGYGQVTYTTDGIGGWIKDPETGGCTTSLEPPFGGVTSCPIIVNIDHPISLTSLNLGNNVSINVNSGGVLNIAGDLNQTSQTTSNISIIGGELNIVGALIVNQGSNSVKTTLNIDIRNGGDFNIELLDIKNDATLNINGDSGSDSPLIVNALNLAQRSIINVATGGGLIVNGLTDYTGNNSSINVRGFFRTGGVLIRGGSGNQLNTFDDAEVIIENDLDVRGNSSILFGGNSEIDIGGDVRVEGGSTVTASQTATVFVCGAYPQPCKEGVNNCDTYELIDGQFSNNCRLLPVEYSDLNVKYSSIDRVVIFSWSTTKEWEASHFEIERAVKGIQFEKVGEVKAAGWSDQIQEYVFEDKLLPLTGGNLPYRLKQVDFNGDYHYSEVLSVKIPGVEFTSGVWRAYPNPTDGNTLRVSLLDASQYQNEPLTFRLVHSTAQTPFVKAASEVELNEVLEGQLRRIPKGVFVVEIQWGQKVEHIKVLKK